MTCRDFVDYLWRYLHEELPAEERSEFDAHLAVCPHCVAYLKEYRATIAMGREALGPGPDGPAPEDAPDELIQAILSARKKS